MFGNLEELNFSVVRGKEFDGGLVFMVAVGITGWGLVHIDNEILFIFGK